MLDFQVTIIPQENYDKSEIASKIGIYFDQAGYNFKEKTVLIKPSFVFAIGDAERTLSTNTNVGLVSGVAQALSIRGASKILIAEDRTIGPARYAFYMINIKKTVNGIKNVKMCYLDEKKKVKVAVNNPFIPNHIIKYPKLLIDDTVDFFISLPKLKANIFADITLSIKNNLGLISKKERLKFHDDRLHMHLADIALIRQPDLIITDAIVSGEGQGPYETTNVYTNMLVVGTNCLAVDVICCYLMDQNPSEIEHLKILHERGIGPLNINDIDIKNKNYLDTKKKKFKMPDINLEMSPSIKVYLGKKSCQAGCLGMIRTFLDGYSKKQGWDSLGELNLILGENIEIPKNELDKLNKKHTIVYGDCAKAYKKYGIYFKGCPPDYVKALLKISLKSSLGKSPWFEYFSPWNYVKAWMVHILQKIFRF